MGLCLHCKGATDSIELLLSVDLDRWAPILFWSLSVLVPALMTGHPIRLWCCLPRLHLASLLRGGGDARLDQADGRCPADRHYRLWLLVGAGVASAGFLLLDF